MHVFSCGLQCQGVTSYHLRHAFRYCFCSIIFIFPTSVLKWWVRRLVLGDSGARVRQKTHYISICFFAKMKWKSRSDFSDIYEKHEFSHEFWKRHPTLYLLTGHPHHGSFSATLAFWPTEALESGQDFHWGTRSQAVRLCCFRGAVRNPKTSPNWVCIVTTCDDYIYIYIIIQMISLWSCFISLIVWY